MGRRGIASAASNPPAAKKHKHKQQQQQEKNPKSMLVAAGAEECACERLPEAVLCRIFAMLPARQVASSCASVCRAWRAAASDAALWAELAGGGGGGGLSGADEARLPRGGGWRALYGAVYGAALLASPCFAPVAQRDVDAAKSAAKHLGRPAGGAAAWEAKHRLLVDRVYTDGDTGEEYHAYSEWAVEGGSQFHRGGGDGVARERPPADCAPCPAALHDYVIATSFDWGRLQQYVGLQSFSNKFLDRSPPLLLTAWHAARCDSPGPASFRMYIVFRDQLKNTLIIWDSGVLASEPGVWQQVRFLIQGYPKGMRSMMVKIAGKGASSQQRGFHGSKFTAVKLNFVPFSQLKHYEDYAAGSLLPPSSI